MALSFTSPDYAQCQANEVATRSARLIQFGTTYVALASIVPADHQHYVTCKGLTYVRPLQWMDEDKVLVNVAALDHRLDAPGKFCTLILTEGQLVQALPYDRTLRNMSYYDCREMVEAHAMEISNFLDQQSGIVTHSTGSISDGQAEGSTQPSTPLREVDEPEPEMFICDGPEIMLSIDTIRQVYSAMEARFHNRRLSRMHLPVLLLEAALFTVVEQMREEIEPLRQKQLQELRRVLALWHRIRPHLDVTLLYAKGQQSQITGCRVQISILHSLAA